MPSWCYNVLTIKGDVSYLPIFREKAKGKKGDLDFNSFIPYPDEFALRDRVCSEIREATAGMDNNAARLWMDIHGYQDFMLHPIDGFNMGGYEWCTSHWGTKWNACCDGGKFVEIAEDHLCYFFDTAWCAPLPVIAEMSRQFPYLEFGLGCDYESDNEHDEYVFKAGAETSHKRSTNEGDSE